MSSLYARIEIPGSSVKQLQDLGVDVGSYSEDADEYPHNGEAWFSVPMEAGSSFLDALERLGFPVPLTGFRETDMMHTSYIFVCPGDGTYYEVQCNEGHQPVVSVVFENGYSAIPEGGAVDADNYFNARKKFEEATR